MESSESKKETTKGLNLKEQTFLEEDSTRMEPEYKMVAATGMETKIGEARTSLRCHFSCKSSQVIFVQRPSQL